MTPLTLLVALATFAVACAPADPAPERPPLTVESPAASTTSRPMRITIHTGTDRTAFTATLADGAAADAFATRLPLTLTMADLHRNEKYADLPVDLPTDASRPDRIESGDLMLFGSATLVLFYETFPTTYRYTRIGRVDDPAGLGAAVGSGSVTATFELE
jgi:hypothetical protein